MRLKVFSGALLTGSFLLLSICASNAAERLRFLSHNDAASAPGRADALSGNWEVTFYDNGRPLPATFSLKLKGTRVTGTVYSDRTGVGSIRDGKLVSGKLSLLVNFKSHQSLVVDGILKDGTLKGTCHHPDGPLFKWEGQKKASQ